MTRGEGRAPTPRLILLNGLPGVGKSTVAAALAARRPGTLNLDIDVVRRLISGDAPAVPEQARALGLAMAVEHLRGGHDVVVPQLVARTDQVRRFEEAADAAGASFVHVLLDAPAELVAERICSDAAPHRRDLDQAALAAYAEGLDEVARTAGVPRLMNHDVAHAVARLELLAAAAMTGESAGQEAGGRPGGSVGTSPLNGR